MTASIESLTLKRVAYRFIPFLMLCYSSITSIA
jgi:hypothetical protein